MSLNRNALLNTIVEGLLEAANILFLDHMSMFTYQKFVYKVFTYDCLTFMDIC